MYLLPRSCEVHPSQQLGLHFIHDSSRLFPGKETLRMIWNREVVPVAMPQKHPIVCIFNLNAIAVDADGVTCSRYCMKVIKRLNHCCDSSDLSNHGAGVGKYVLVELREQGGNSCSIKAIESDVDSKIKHAVDIPKAAIMSNDPDASSMSISYANKSAHRLESTLTSSGTHVRGLHLKNLIGGTKFVSS